MFDWVLNTLLEPFTVALQNSCPKEFRKSHIKTQVMETFFEENCRLKSTSIAGFSYEFCEIFRNSFLIEDLCVTVSCDWLLKFAALPNMDNSTNNFFGVFWNFQKIYPRKHPQKPSSERTVSSTLITFIIVYKQTIRCCS